MTVTLVLVRLRDRKAAPCESPETLHYLIDSIRIQRLQDPLLFQEVDGHYEVIHGNRRYHAITELLRRGEDVHSAEYRRFFPASWLFDRGVLHGRVAKPRHLPGAVRQATAPRPGFLGRQVRIVHAPGHRQTRSSRRASLKSRYQRHVPVIRTGALIGAADLPVERRRCRSTGPGEMDLHISPELQVHVPAGAARRK
jgi:ParB-like nuclease domain